MNQKQIVKMDMYEREDQHFESYADLYGTFLPLADEISVFRNILAQLRQQFALRGEETQGMRMIRREVFRGCISDLVPLCRKALAWARRNGRPDLEPVFDVHESDFMHGAEQNGILKAHASAAALLKVSPSLVHHNVTVAAIESIDDRITAYGKLKPEADVASDRKEAAGEQINLLMHGADEALAIADDLIESEFGKSHAGVVAQHFLHREIGRVAHRHTGLHVSAMAVATGLPVEGIQVAIRELARTVLTDINGEGEIISFRPGGYHVDYIKDGAVIRSEVVTFKRGVVVDRSVEV